MADGEEEPKEGGGGGGAQRRSSSGSAGPGCRSLDWPLSREEKKGRALRLYDRDVKAADQLIESGEAALIALQKELQKVRRASGDLTMLAPGRVDRLNSREARRSREDAEDFSHSCLADGSFGAGDVGSIGARLAVAREGLCLPQRPGNGAESDGGDGNNSGDCTPELVRSLTSVEGERGNNSQCGADVDATEYSSDAAERLKLAVANVQAVLNSIWVGETAGFEQDCCRGSVEFPTMRPRARSEGALLSVLPPPAIKRAPRKRRSRGGEELRVSFSVPADESDLVGLDGLSMSESLPLTKHGSIILSPSKKFAGSNTHSEGNLASDGHQFELPDPDPEPSTSPAASPAKTPPLPCSLQQENQQWHTFHRHRSCWLEEGLPGHGDLHAENLFTQSALPEPQELFVSPRKTASVTPDALTASVPRQQPWQRTVLCPSGIANSGHHADVDGTDDASRHGRRPFVLPRGMRGDRGDRIYRGDVSRCVALIPQLSSASLSCDKRPRSTTDSADPERDRRRRSTCGLSGSSRDDRHSSACFPRSGRRRSNSLLADPSRNEHRRDHLRCDESRLMVQSTPRISTVVSLSRAPALALEDTPPQQTQSQERTEIQVPATPKVMPASVMDFF